MKHVHLIGSSLCALTLLAGCGAPAQTPVAETGKLHYDTPHFQISLPSAINGSPASVMTRVYKDDRLHLDYSVAGDDIRNISVMVAREPVAKYKTAIADMKDRGSKELPAYTLHQGVEGVALAYDLHDFPDDTYRTCSVSRTYTFAVLKSMYTVAFDESQNVSLEGDDWKKNCTILSEAGHAAFVDFVNAAMDTFQLDEPS